MLSCVIMCVQKDDKQPLLLSPAHHNKISPLDDNENPEFKIDVSSYNVRSVCKWVVNCIPCISESTCICIFYGSHRDWKT